MKAPTMTFWLNGEFHDSGGGVIDVADKGFLLGDGVFETLLVREGAPAFLSAHLERIAAGARALLIDTAFDEGEIASVIATLAVRNGATTGDASARLTLTRGIGDRGLDFGEGAPTILLTLSPFSLPSQAAPVRLTISEFVRSEHTINARHKTLSYLDNVLARAAASRLGFDDAVMLNSAGRVACVAAANLFLIRANGVVVTPPVEEGALPGIVRSCLLAEAGCGVEEALVTRADLAAAAAMFMTNSLIGFRPAVLDDQSQPDARAMAIMHRLQSCYLQTLQQDLQKRAAQ